MALHALALFAALCAAPAPRDVKLNLFQGPDGSVSPVLDFTDAEGLHRVSFVSSSRKEDRRNRTLDITHEVQATADAPWKQVWTAKDFVKGCDFDLTLRVLERSISVTDLNGDGKAEVSFMYAAGCRSDVSPLTLKLLMYDGATKYALRGGTLERVGTDAKGKPEMVGGDFTADKAFDSAPKEFLPYAKAQWAKFRVVPEAP